MDDVIKWVVEYWPTVLLGLYALANVVNAVLRLIPGEQGEQEGGWLSKARSVLDRFSVLTGQGDPSSLKLPGKTSETPDSDE